MLTTHAHSDHIDGIRQLASIYKGLRVACHQLERDSVTRDLPVSWEPAKDGVVITLGALTITPLYTPGHTPGATCYCVDGVCFVGDTIFAGSIGRPSGHAVYQQMLAGIRAKVLSLPDETVLLPGHGPATTVGVEKVPQPVLLARRVYLSLSASAREDTSRCAVCCDVRVRSSGW